MKKMYKEVTVKILNLGKDVITMSGETNEDIVEDIFD